MTVIAHSMLQVLFRHLGISRTNLCGYKWAVVPLLLDQYHTFWVIQSFLGKEGLREPLWGHCEDCETHLLIKVTWIHLDCPCWSCANEWN